MKKIIFPILLLLCAKAFAFDSAGYETKIGELKDLMSQCEQMGIECPYEQMNITVMEQFQSGENISNESYVSSKLDDIYESTKSALTSYINGEKKPLSAPRYQTSDINISKNKLIADTTWGQRPVFFIGYGHFAEARNNFDKFAKLGANITQQEIGPWSVIYEAKVPYGWKITSGGDVVCEANYDKANVRGGEVSLKLERGDSDGYVIIGQSYKVEPNTSYTCTLTAKADAANSVYVTPYSGAERNVIGASSLWKTYKYTFTTGEETETEFNIIIDKKASAYIDNISVRKDASAENLINNGNFEKNANRFGDNNEYIAVTDGIEKSIIPMLDSAEKNNVAVDLLISPHYFPVFVKNYYPDINIYHRQHRIIMDKYIETLISLIKDKPALMSICISNEPTSDSSQIDGLLSDWHEWLLGKYQGIDAINSAFGTAYTSADEIQMPSKVSQTREFYDWMEYNDTKFAVWHSRIADKIRELMPNVKIHSKVQDYFAQDGSGEFERGRLKWGTDAEKFSEFSDFSGNDSHAYYQSPSRPIQGKMKWYDFLSSIKTAPVFNSEDHIIRDSSKRYDDMVAKFVSADIFQGALHGRYADTIWTWEQTSDETSLFLGNVFQRPDALAAIGKASLDLNRLSYEISAFNDKRADAAILYSNLERVYNKDFVTAMDKAYDACLYAGQKAEFVTENDIDKLSDYKLLIVPNVVHADRNLQSAVQEFISSGKKVIWIGECFTKDEFDKNISFEKSESVELSDDLTEIVYNSCDSYIKLCDEAGALPPEGVEWKTTEYNGKILVNICNYRYTDLQGLSVVYKGKKRSVKNLLTNETLGESFTAKAYEPLILEIDSECRVRIKSTVCDNGLLTVIAENYGDSDEKITLSTSVSGQKKMFGGEISRSIKAGDILKGSFSFPSGEGKGLFVGVYDESGILIEEKNIDM